MTAVEEAAAKRAVALKTVRNWIQPRFSRCHFAGLFETAERIRWTALLVDDGFGAIDSYAEFAGQESEFAAFVFPEVRDPISVALLIQRLAELPRWEFEIRERDSAPPHTCSVALTWLTETGFRSEAMGLAPLGTMPATRRAPYTSVIVWPGGRDNPHKESRTDGVVGFIDGNHGLSKDAFETTLAETSDATRRVLRTDGEKSKELYRIAFTLPASVRPILEPLL